MTLHSYLAITTSINMAKAFSFAAFVACAMVGIVGVALYIFELQIVRGCDSRDRIELHEKFNPILKLQRRK